MEIVIIAVLATTAYLFYIFRQLREREHVYYMRVVISDKNPQDLYAQPYHPVRGSIIVVSKPTEIAQKINLHFNIKEHQNVFIEHVQALN